MGHMKTIYTDLQEQGYSDEEIQEIPLKEAAKLCGFPVSKCTCGGDIDNKCPYCQQCDKNGGYYDREEWEKNNPPEGFAEIEQNYL